MKQLIIYNLILFTGWIGCSSNERPEVIISSPEDGSVVRGEVTVSALAKDEDSIVKFELFIDDTLRYSANTFSFIFSWETDAYPDSSIHSIYANACDIYGNEGFSDTFWVISTITGTEKWRFQTSGDILSSPALSADGIIYVGSNDGYLYAINPDGTLYWRYRTYGAVQSSPAICPDGSICVGSFDNCLYVINPNGSFKWAYETGDAVYSSPAIGADGTIYFGSADGYVYAIHYDGTYQWRYQTNDMVWSSPAIDANGTIYICSDDGYLYALNPSGALIWSYWLGGQFYQHYAYCPAIGSDSTIYVAAKIGYPSEDYLFAFNNDGSLKWQCRVHHYYSYLLSPVIGTDGTIYVNGSCAFSPDGKWIWNQAGGVPAALCADGTIFTAFNDFRAISPYGTLQWISESCKGTTAPTIGEDGTIYIGARSQLWALHGSIQLANTPWPMFRHDSKHTGRIGGGF